MGRSSIRDPFSISKARFKCLKYQIYFWSINSPSYKNMKVLSVFLDGSFKILKRIKNLKKYLLFTIVLNVQYWFDVYFVSMIFLRQKCFTLPLIYYKVLYYCLSGVLLNFHLSLFVFLHNHFFLLYLHVYFMRGFYLILH